MQVALFALIERTRPGRKIGGIKAESNGIRQLELGCEFSGFFQWIDRASNDYDFALLEFGNPILEVS